MTPLIPKPGEGVVGFEAEHDRDDGLAVETLETLVYHYPHWAWHVLIKGGCIFITNRDFPTGWGMNIKMDKVSHDAKVRKQAVMRMAGEFLERANVVRGGMREQPVTAIEGVPQKDIRAA